MRKNFRRPEKKKNNTLRMAVSIHDAWNDFIITDNKQSNETVKQPVMQHNNEIFHVSAKSVENTIKSNNVNTTEKAEIELKYMNLNRDNIKMMENVVNHLSELRKEEARRSSIYIIMGAMLFAFLFMYIDKLQNKIKNLTYSIHHQASRRTENSRSPMHAEPFQWYQ